MKKNILFFVLGLIVAGSIGVYATTQILASNVDYKNGKKVSEALDDLYSKVGTSLKLCKFIDSTYGTKGNVGSKYECKLGDGETRYFYILTVNSNNTVDLIMDRNINDQTFNKSIALNYFSTGAGSNYYNLWKGVIDIKLPSIIPIVRVTGNNSWNISSEIVCLGTGFKDLNQGPWCNPSPNKAWLFDYLKGSTSFGGNNEINDNVYGYWALEEKTNTNNSWGVDYRSVVATTSKDTTDYNGIRPVITILKSSLYE